jgi:multidrug efflux system outer membrane protein
MNRKTPTLLLGISALALLHPSCKTMVGPDYTGPGGTTVPDAWTRSVLGDLQGRSLAKWWKGFNDPALDTLVERAREANPDLKAALARIAEARAQRGVAASQALPQLNGGGSYSRNRTSENLFFVPPVNPTDLYAAGFDAGWEIDLFGGIRRSVEAAEASIEARYEDYRDALVTLFAEVALNYIDYRTLQERIAVAERNIATQRESVELTRSRLEAGLVPRIDVTQAETNLAVSEAAVPALREQLVAARNRLATLTGGFPASVEGTLARSRGIPSPRAGYAAGLPADLLRARPDIRRAERELAAQTARIGVAEAELYPRFSLFGELQLQSVESGNFFESASTGYGFGPSFRWRLFTSGQVRNLIAAEESRAQAALAAYEKSVLRAVEEVETGMAGIANERDRLAALGQAVAASRETVSLVKDNYENGLVNFQNVLDAERTKFDVEDQETFSRGRVSANYVVLYKALGGGVESEYVPEAGPVARGSRWRRARAETAAAAVEGAATEPHAEATPEAVAAPATKRPAWRARKAAVADEGASAEPAS